MPVQSKLAKIKLISIEDLFYVIEKEKKHITCYKKEHSPKIYKKFDLRGAKLCKSIKLPDLSHISWRKRRKPHRSQATTKIWKNARLLSIPRRPKQRVYQVFS